MQQNNQSKKVLLKITDLKQWFPIKKTKLFQKEQLYVRANDGITLDIYEGGDGGPGRRIRMRKIDIWKDTASALSTDGRKNDVLWPDSLGDGPGLCGTHGEKILSPERKRSGNWSRRPGR